MTDQLDTAAMRELYQLNSSSEARIICALCDALDDARQCVSHANLHADCAIADMKALRAENERLLAELARFREERAYVVGWNDGFARAALAQKEAE